MLQERGPGKAKERANLRGAPWQQGSKGTPLRSCESPLEKNPGTEYKKYAQQSAAADGKPPLCSRR